MKFGTFDYTVSNIHFLQHIIIMVVNLSDNVTFITKQPLA